MKTIWQKDYNMVFWANEDRDPIHTVLKVNNFLKDYGNDYVLKYLNEHEEIAMDQEALEERCRIRREKGEPISQSYFSHNRIWFACGTGTINFFADSQVNSPPNFLKFEFDFAHLQPPNPVMDFSRLIDLFTFCIYTFRPYYGWLTMSGETNYSSIYHKKFNSVNHLKVPTAIEWFNYFDLDWVKRFGGLENLLSAPVYLTEPTKEIGGVTLILQEEPFDYKNSDHLQNRQKVEDYLNLKELQQKFKKG